MFERVLVAWDGSERARDAAEWSADRPATRSVVLLHVDDGVAPAPTAQDAEEAARGLRGRRPGLEVRTEVVRGDRESELARHRPDTMLVLGVAGCDAMRFPLRYGLAARLVAHAAVPVALVPSDARDRHGDVVVGSDGTAASEAAALVAASEAEDLRAPLVEIAVRHGGAVYDTRPEAIRMLQQQRSSVRRFLHRSARAGSAAPGDAVLELAVAARDAALLVLARGEGGAGREPVAHEIATRISAPMIFVKETDLPFAATA
ncbi:universal stress protein [Amnibacterium sp. CER49]|uniref:universal stress protein n=1 Tax=Amnibacterium sp. CER49 TaxID=3039161 RepID=UPI00244B5CBD|nr:universal stress protein [Amnibacterium sp. CER49]MDH2442530.1 universal stress protein [Amnibacterium sp. CER49]